MNPNLSQRQNNFVTVSNDFDKKSSNLLNNFKSISTSSDDVKVDKNPQRRFTRKQLLSRPVNRKEKILYCNNNATSLAACASPPSPQSRGEEEDESCSCNPHNNAAQVCLPIGRSSNVTKVYTDANTMDEDEEKKFQPSPASSTQSVKDVKTVHFNINDDDVISRSIQVTPPQFRLRFVPHIKCSIHGLCLMLLRIVASQLGLTIFLIVWTLLGAYAFSITEGEYEASLVHELRLLEGRLTLDLISELRQVPVEHQKSWWRIIENGIKRQEEALSEALSSGYAPNGGVIWNYAGSLLFAVNMLTTIGFGAPVPRTPLGRTSAVIYSAVSIPLHLILVVNFGALVADKLELCLRRAKKRQRRRNILELGNMDSNNLEDFKPPVWLSWLPVLAIVLYYLFGIVLFGGAPLFPLDFTTAGGVGQRSSTLRAIYAVYLEFAVVLAGISVNIWRNTASSGFIKLGLKLDLLARGRNYS